MKILWLPMARKNRADQLAYVGKDSAQAAIVVGDRLRDQVRELAKFPDMGRPGRKRGTRELVISRTSLVVVYRVRPRLARVEIIRVLHSSQQWPGQALGQATDLP